MQLDRLTTLRYRQARANKYASALTPLVITRHAANGTVCANPNTCNREHYREVISHG